MPIPVCGYITCPVGRFPIYRKAWTCLHDGDNSSIKYTKCLRIQTTEITGGYTLAQGLLLPATVEGNVNAAKTGLEIMKGNIHADDGLQIGLENDIQTGEMTTGGDEENIL